MLKMNNECNHESERFVGLGVVASPSKVFLARVKCRAAPAGDRGNPNVNIRDKHRGKRVTGTGQLHRWAWPGWPDAARMAYFGNDASNPNRSRYTKKIT